jgi:uncharacterized membrane protein YkvA (DUF1232 family)
LNLLHRLRQWARTLKRDVVALSRSAQDPRVPWYAKVVAASVAAYALSPIDLIPDFIPVLGYLDDVILVPLGIALAICLIPPDVLEEHRRAASEGGGHQPRSWIGAAIIVTIWIAFVALSFAWIAQQGWSI